MKKLIIFATLLGAQLLFAKTRVAVTELEDKSGSGRCSVSWLNNVGFGLTEQLLTELSKVDRYALQERVVIEKIYNTEHKLINAKKTSLPKKNQFLTAEYSIVGAVTSFELCAEDNGAEVGLDGGWVGVPGIGLKVGAKKEQARVAMDIRIVKVETGEIVKSFTTEGTSDATGFKLGADVRAIDFNMNKLKSTPLGEASRKAIQAAVEKINKAI